jgi:L-galactose dehydrogenase
MKQQTGFLKPCYAISASEGETDMDYVKFGKTGLEVSIAGLGCGGHSRLGQGYGAAPKDSVRVVQAALESGINYIDTAAVYGTETIVGQALRGQRDKAILSTKAMVVQTGTSALGTDFAPADQVRSSLEDSLSNLGTDYIDVFHLHGVTPAQYEHCKNHLVPELHKFREEGKIRFFGLTERFIYDPGHKMLTMALQDDFWDVMMVGFNMLNPSARNRVFAQTREQGIGTLVMFAVRKALSDMTAFRELLDGLIEDGLVDQDKLNMSDPLCFLLTDDDASSVINAAYRFCRHEPGADVVLSGTGSIKHLLENISSISQPPISKTSSERLETLFGHIDTISGN